MFSALRKGLYFVSGVLDLAEAALGTIQAVFRGAEGHRE